MTKITGRVLLILLLSAAVAAVIWVLVETATGTAGIERNNPRRAAHASREGDNHHHRDSFHLSSDSSGNRVAGRHGTSDRHHNAARGFSPGRGLAGIVRSIVVISLITFTVNFIAGKRLGCISRKPVA